MKEQLQSIKILDVLFVSLNSTAKTSADRYRLPAGACSQPPAASKELTSVLPMDSLESKCGVSIIPYKISPSTKCESELHGASRDFSSIGIEYYIIHRNKLVYWILDPLCTPPIQWELLIIS
ncbi:hypothetical protein PanWU01x14_215390 [Parasponia andersonii]|uniref:Uncharacterized protein n=1 Tax=Parasponia andersonii TaxID=3476 RepID=A0A2P5BS32_PARAD|nr:hypothetical protein PanWU01x14_215390 [Parasponia andersonii]